MAISEILQPLLDASTGSIDVDPQPMLDEKQVVLDRRSDELEFTHADRLLSGLATLLFNLEDPDPDRFNKGEIQRLVGQIDGLVNTQINAVLHDEKFQAMESVWRSVEDLVMNVDFGQNIEVSLLDAKKEELMDDFETNAIDISKSALFEKVYIHEYDQYGGRPFGALVGLYEFSNTPDDILWLQTMGKVANAAHAPFVGAASPKFFGFDTAEEFAEIKDLAGLLAHPKFGRWNKFRKTEEAAYVGLTFPRYILRMPYNPETNPSRYVNFTETVGGQPQYDEDGNLVSVGGDGYLWGNASILVARNMARSFATSGWCQYIRGPKGGGLIEGLPVYSYMYAGRDVIKPPVEITIPDYKELEFANNGFMPLVWKKGSANAAFFSVQSAKAPEKFKDPKDSENSQLVANMAYTMSITRIAHYVKSVMRDNIGFEADGSYIQNQLNSWLQQYVTAVKNPDDLTARVYPFRAASVNVSPRDGQIGFYDCEIAVLPHLQFEGMDVELRLDSRLG